VRDAVEQVVEPFLTAADAVLGPGYSALLYGSAARGDYVPGRSDINLLLILDAVAPPTLRGLGPAFAAWRKSSPHPPLVIARAEWDRADDTFPIELADMRTAYRVLRGADPLAGRAVDRADLRRAVERELRGKLLRLRQGYVAAAADQALLGEVAGRSAATIMVLLRAILVLLDRAVPGNPLELAAAAAGAIGVDGEPLLDVIRHRAEAGWRCTPREFEEYLDTVARATVFVDQLQLGDLR
jgi:predicted nucleotidyltransferase